MKTRLQLQGELQKADPNVPKVYKNVGDAFLKTWRNEGIKGIQRGLLPAYGYQILLNGSRLGFYEPMRRLLNRVVGLDPSKVYASTAVTAGAATGCIGAVLGSPLFLVKAYSPALPVGAQHKYRNSFDALRTILRSDGLRGLWRGSGAAMLRTASGSSVQLPSYNATKNVLASWGWAPNSYATYFTASAVSGVCVNTVTDPVTGRVRGALYKNAFDCLWKTMKSEGVRGLYKGVGAHFARIFPHTVLTLVANEGVMRQYTRLRGH
ncbi:Mitochondrial oxaloacetate transport protein [Saitozyma sp. JCM 24511]|nr:Mitochondrial oxaloacetate transport protein [Saitozyma sp. JCM 24511]